MKKENLNNNTVFIDNIIGIIKKDDSYYSDALLENLVEDMYAYSWYEYKKGKEAELKETFLDYSKKDIDKYILFPDTLNIYCDYFNIKRYEGKIELSDYRVLNDIKITITSEEYWLLVEEALLNFEELVYNKYNLKIKIWQRWRSGRHIVIEETSSKIDLLNNLFKIIEDYNEAENKFIEFVNSIR